VTTGAANDIEKATELARAMVTQYGMSDKFGLMSLESIESRYLDGRPVLNCSDETAGEIDKEVMKILKECYDRAEKLLSENREALDKIADYLITKETITGEEFMKIFNEVKGTEPDNNENKPAKLNDSLDKNEETEDYATAEGKVNKHDDNITGDTGDIV